MTFYKPWAKFISAEPGVFESILAPLQIWMHLALGVINLNFSFSIRMQWRQKQSKETAANIRISTEVQGLLEQVCSSQTEKSCNVSSEVFPYAPPYMHVHTLSRPESTPYGRLWAGKTSPQKYSSSPLCYRLCKQQVETSICYKDLPTSWQMSCREVNSSGLTNDFVFLRCFMLSGAVGGKGWKSSIRWVF